MKSNLPTPEPAPADELEAHVVKCLRNLLGGRWALYYTKDRIMEAFRKRLAAAEKAFDNFVADQTKVQPEPKHPTLWRYLENARKAGVHHFSLVSERMPDGGFHFYLHPSGVSGDTHDYLICPAPFTHEDLIVNRLDSPAPDVGKFKELLTKIFPTSSKT